MYYIKPRTLVILSQRTYFIQSGSLFTINHNHCDKWKEDNADNELNENGK